MLLINKINADVILFNINDYIKCLRKNIDNVNIKKIFVFMELSTDNLPCSDKVSYFIKKGYTDEQTLNYSRKLFKGKIIIANPFLTFSFDLFKIEFDNNGIIGKDYLIFNENQNYYDINSFKRYNLQTDILKIKNDNIVIKSTVEKFNNKLNNVSTKIDNINRKLDVIITSINYNKYLSVTLPNNKKYFKNITVSTSADDIECIEICKSNNIKYVITDNVSLFNINKSMCINTALKSLDNPDFVLLLDADIIITKTINLDNLDNHTIYTSDRIIYEEIDDYFKGKNKSSYEKDKGLGFFQLFKYTNSEYPESNYGRLSDGIWSDIKFRNGFKYKKNINAGVIHLGKPYQKWQKNNISKKDNKSPLVSIIITNYNNEKYLYKCISSAINQSYKNIEIIIIDDKSTDSSLDIIRSFLYDSRVNVYKNSVNMGTYWSKNSMLSKINGDFVTMLDSDDYDDNLKIEKQVNEFLTNESLNIVTVNYQKDDKVIFGWPSMMFRKKVFNDVGFYDSVRFGADSEFYDRCVKFYGKNTIKHIGEVLQYGFVHEGSLTYINKENSKIRKDYIKNYTEWHNNANNLFMEFPLIDRKFKVSKKMLINNNLNLYDIDKEFSTHDVLPIIMCTWKRIDGFNKVLNQLKNQLFKQYKLFIWNNNTELINEFVNILDKSGLDYEIINSDENIGGFGRFYYAAKIRRRPGLLNHCVFIDDDQKFKNDTLTTFYNEIENKTIKSQFGWKFKGLDYYVDRDYVNPGMEIHYCGTGGMLADMSVFEDDELFNCPREYWFVEDLWLSYYSTKLRGYKCYKSKVIMENGDDIYSLYKIVKDIKTPMLRYLVNDLGWNILDEL